MDSLVRLKKLGTKLSGDLLIGDDAGCSLSSRDEELRDASRRCFGVFLLRNLRFSFGEGVFSADDAVDLLAFNLKEQITLTFNLK